MRRKKLRSRTGRGSALSAFMRVVSPFGHGGGAGRKSEGIVRPGHAEQDLEQQEPAFQVHRDEEVFFGVLPAVLADLRSELWMREQIPYLVGAALHRVHE